MHFKFDIQLVPGERWSQTYCICCRVKPDDDMAVLQMMSCSAQELCVVHSRATMWRNSGARYADAQQSFRAIAYAPHVDGSRWSNWTAD
jgi:hypothetical protein